MKRVLAVFAAALLLGAGPCQSNGDATAPVTATGVGQFNGTYSGTWSGPQSNGQDMSGSLTVNVSNGRITGTPGNMSGSTNTLSGTVSETGAITANVPAGPNGCSVTFTGQVTVSSGLTVARGTYQLIDSPTCSMHSGSWLALR
jgi:hypothetical protein